MTGTAHSLAKLINYSLLHPTLAGGVLRAGCEQAKKYQVASVSIKPYAAPLAWEVSKEAAAASRQRSKKRKWPATTASRSLTWC